jgi:hypothetical protein
MTVPKITVHGGPTNADAGPGEVGYIPPAEVTVGTVADLTSEPVYADDEEEGERPSRGSSSSTSPARQPPSGEPPATDPPKRARTTGSRSKPARAGSSTASSTGGAPTRRADART